MLGHAKASRRWTSTRTSSTVWAVLQTGWAQQSDLLRTSCGLAGLRSCLAG